MICVTLVNRFRWVACQLDELKKCTKRQKSLDYILESLPETLEGTYDQILSRISPADASDAVKLLLWLAFAKYALHIDYLAIIVEFDMDKKRFNPDAKLSSPEEVLKICSSLVTRMGDDTVQLAHASVQKYVQEKKRTIQFNIVIDPAIGNKFVGQCCLAHLVHSRESHPVGHFELLDTSLRKRYLQSLVRYSAKYWPTHILAANLDVPANEQIKELFVLTSLCFQNWVQVHNYEHHFSPEKQMSSRSLLQCAAFHGLCEIVSKLSLDEREADVNADGGRCIK